MAGFEIREKKIPDNYVELADQYMEKKSRYITTSKLRNILSLFTSAYNKELVSSYQNINSRNVKISSSTENALLSARVRIVYECGRDKEKVGRFVQDTKILDYLKGLHSSQADFMKFYHYLEALVAYHKFYGGREN